MKDATKKPCAECPFRVGAPRGYLGPWNSPQELLEQAFSEGGFACHMTVKESGHWDKGTQYCAGSLICANKSAKTYRDPELRRLQDSFKTDDPSVLFAWDFAGYHSPPKRRSS